MPAEAQDFAADYANSKIINTHKVLIICVINQYHVFLREHK